MYWRRHQVRKKHRSELWTLGRQAAVGSVCVVVGGWAHEYIMMLLLLSVCVCVIIIMYIYHALISALSAHMIHINLNVIFCTHVKHSPTKTIYIKYNF